MRRWPILMLALLAAPAGANLTEQQLSTAIANPPPGARLPATLAFVDQSAHRTTLGEAAAGRPLVLIFADYTCAHVCGPGLTLTAGALHDAKLAPGRDYSLAVVGIDPKDGPREAAAMAGARLSALPAEAAAARLLSADAATIARATAGLGYRYLYDAASDQFAHDASVYVFAADGRLSTLLPELALRPETLRAAILRPATAPSFAARVAHLCYGFAAASGRFGRPVSIALELFAALFLLAGAGALWRLRRAAA